MQVNKIIHEISQLVIKGTEMVITEGGSDVIHLPVVKREWTIGTVLAAITSTVSLLATLVTVVWFAAKLDTVTQHVPSIQQRQSEQDRAIAVLQDQQRYTDLRYAEIMTQLATINQKLDSNYAKSNK